MTVVATFVALALMTLGSHGAGLVPGRSTAAGVGQTSVDGSSLFTGKTVQLDLYMETLCPYCARFVKSLQQLMAEEGFGDILDLKFVAWGNAEVTSSGKVECQHGPEECVMNRVTECVMHLLPDQSKWFNWSACVEGSEAAEIEAKAESCAKDSSLDWTAIKECATGDLGDKLELAAKAATDALVPAHKWVPWVLINGVPIYDDTANLKQIVCVAYTGKRPAACFDPPPSKSRNARQWLWALVPAICFLAAGLILSAAAVRRRVLGCLLFCCETRHKTSRESYFQAQHLHAMGREPLVPLQRHDIRV